MVVNVGPILVVHDVFGIISVGFVRLGIFSRKIGYLFTLFRPVLLCVGVAARFRAFEMKVLYSAKKLKGQSFVLFYR